MGYVCRGSYLFDGRRYDQAIPGNRLRAPGSTLAGVVARDDPTLLTTAGVLATEHPSWRVYLAPAVLVVVDLGLLALLAVRRRRSGPARAPRGGAGVAQAGGV